jgi:hypothetical protein
MSTEISRNLCKVFGTWMFVTSVKYVCASLELAVPQCGPESLASGSTGQCWCPSVVPKTGFDAAESLTSGWLAHWCMLQKPRVLYPLHQTMGTMCTHMGNTLEARACYFQCVLGQGLTLLAVMDFHRVTVL